MVYGGSASAEREANRHDPDEPRPIQTSNPERKVPTRRISFEESLQDLPRHFAADGDLISGHVVAALSAVFPDGEDFFVRSVRHYRDRITDPELKRQVTGFIGQEAMHGREHRAFNDRLAELGYPTKRFERFTGRACGSASASCPPMSNLAATAALEHFTATLAELVLTQRGDPRAHRPRRGPQPLPLARARGVRAQGGRLRRLQGGRRQRAAAGLDHELPPLRVRRAAWRWPVIVSLLGDRATYRRGNLRRAGGASGARRSRIPAIWAQLRDYNRPDFHPDDRDTTELVERWRAELFGEHGTLNDKLIGAAA